jgi:hypothetical protein
MLQEYVPIVLGVSVLCCSKCFHVIFKKVFHVCKLQVFYLDVAYVSYTCFKCCSNYFICFKRMLHSNVLCFRGVFRESWGTAQAPGDRASEPGVGGQGVWHD